MTRRVTMGVLVMVLLVGIVVVANELPVLEDQYVVTRQGEAAGFALTAEDAEIDPYASAPQRLEFVLLDGPSHGVLTGDLEAVVYTWPHSATVAMTYIPADGFVGTDSITYSVVDSSGASPIRAATVEFEVLDVRGEGLLAGTWDAEFTFDVPSASVEAFSQRLTEVYRIGGLTAKGTAEFAMESPGGVKTILFNALRFESSLDLGSFDLEVTLAMDPQGGAVGSLFDYLLTRVAVPLFGVSLSHSLYLTLPQTQSYQVFTLQGTAGDLDFSNTLRFGLGEDCGFVFAGNDALVAWRWCGVQFRATSSFADDGFESLTLAASSIPVPSFALLPGGVTMDVAFTFGLSSKTVDAYLDWKPLRQACIRILGSLTVAGTPETTIDEVWLYGLIIECEPVPGVRAKSATSFDPQKNATVTGQIDYFESFSLGGELASCCGIPGTWSFVTYFDHGSAKLFDWGMTLLKADVGVSEYFSFRLEAVIRSGALGDPTSELAIGWTVRW